MDSWIVYVVKLLYVMIENKWIYFKKEHKI
jgi:hypothetical protein